MDVDQANHLKGATIAEKEERGSWGGRFEFFLSCLGYAIGLGNVWRFPYLCYRNGGATFLIPYVIMLVVAGLPLFFLELAVGQFASEGPITVWKVSPAFHGIGVAMVTINGMVCIYYNVIITYAIYYMFVSFINLDGSVPWESCGNPWNTNSCRTSYPPLHTMNETSKLDILSSELYNKDCVVSLLGRISSMFNNTFTDFTQLNSSMVLNDATKECRIRYTSPSAEYWERHVLRLHEADGFGDMGSISLKNAACLVVAWLIIFACIMKGIKSSGKVVYFTATFPYVILVVLLIRGLTLEGCEKGITFYMTPQVHRLKEAKVWGDAATQIFFSLGAGFGSLLTMSSYNKFKNNCERDAVIVAIINCATSVFAGFAIFSLLGFMAHTTNQDVESVVDQGPGFAFIAYPEGIAQLPVSPLWAFLFFFMLLTLGIGTQFVMMETLISGVSDIFPRFLRKHKTPFTAICCLVGFLLGLPQVTKGGIYMLTLMDWYCGSYNVMLVALAEIICLMYVYPLVGWFWPRGGNRRSLLPFMEDIEMMIGHKPNPYWVINWVFLTPVVIIFILIVSATQYTPANYGDYKFPPWAEGIGWWMVVAPVAMILLVMAIQVCRQGMLKAFSPTQSWGPALPEDQTGNYASLGSANGTMPKVTSVKMAEKPSDSIGVENKAFFTNIM
ncbi:sodium- and chloride-dependent glycine transporter 1-like isoform X1 [Haliotis rufescens]|uniref:sodium- and chloride-dependent glycine transporter 1-like isoform X1 n=2 Tax=Haliotis rufescens TaxID=6454 RepID=UPI00201EA5BE|nr:sodium- and chloride-dependent glycine transporter 1-like isoform X1 [Haliotis rufescens]